MQRNTSEALRAWFRRVEPVYPELFNTAHAMCGNDDLAEYALRSAMLEVWAQDPGRGMGFRERLRSALRQAATQTALSQERPPEFTWPGFSAAQDDDPVLRQAAQERIEVQRLIMLRHGCGLSLRTSARLCGLSAAQARTLLERFESRCRSGMSGVDRARTEALIARSARKALARPGEDIPGPGQVYRALEAEAAGVQAPRRRVFRWVGRAVAVAVALLCAALFWVFAVLVQPTPVSGAPAGQSSAVPGASSFQISEEMPKST